MIWTVMLPGIFNKEPGGTSSTRPVTGQNVVAMEIGIIWKPYIVDGRDHHILENNSGLKHLAITISISMACALP